MLGADPQTDGVVFSCFCSTTERCFVRLKSGDHRLEPLGDGIFETLVRGVEPGTSYMFVLDDRELPDPYARFLPHGVHGPAQVVKSTHRWRSEAAPRPIREQVIYELHVGAFTARGTYLSAAERLPDLVRLGVTTIELMPVSAFAGDRGWGYDGVAHFAPFAPYGTPDELREFVDTAHELGLLVLLDVVYNHFGPAGNYLRQYSPKYFTSAIATPWGEAPDFSHPMMRRYVLDNARYWLEDFRFDGLRLDAIQHIVDHSDRHIIRELSDQVKRLKPEKLLIAETDECDASVVTALGCDALWADDFHHQLHVTLTGEKDGYYRAFAPGVQGIAEVIEAGWLRASAAAELAAERFVFCIQNHDQIGNRALGDRLSSAVSLEAYVAASALLLLLPMTPLLFMGQEWATSSPFLYFTDHDPALGAQIRRGRREEFKGFLAFTEAAARERIPDPQALETFDASRLNWEERDEPTHHGTLELYRELLALRRTDPVLSRATRQNLRVEARGDVLLVRIEGAFGVRLLLVNFGKRPVSLQELGVAEDRWQKMMSTRDSPHGLPSECALLLSPSPAV